MPGIRVALFIPSLGGGGAERVVVLLANAMAKHGMLVDVVLGEAKGNNLVNIDNQVNIVNLNKSRIHACLFPLSRYLYRERPFVLISALDHANLVALLARSITCVPVRVIITLHGVYSDMTRDFPGLRSRIICQAIKWLYSCADSIVAVSEGVAEDIITMAGISRNLVQVIKNPAIYSQILALAREPVNHSFFVPGKPPVILAAGSLIAPKEFSTLIRAFAIVLKQRSCRLLIMGEGPERRNLEQLIRALELEKEVSMPGFVENPYAFMARSAVFVVPSRSESMSLVLVEAMAIGLPVVATNCKYGPREILQNGKYGRIVPVGDTLAMANAIQLSLTEPPPRIPPEVLQPFTVDFALSKYEHLISELAKP